MHSPEFIFEHPSGLRISRGLREAEVSTLEGVGRRDMGTGYVWYSLPSRNSESDNILMSLCFHSATQNPDLQEDKRIGGGYCSMPNELLFS